MPWFQGEIVDISLNVQKTKGIGASNLQI